MLKKINMKVEAGLELPAGSHSRLSQKAPSKILR